ncbi:hypothetical protein PYK79_21150 [Streptomyces sp. ID05-04B]|uniref:hypothetical protein n=1 Tax=unclassified Streptomyces TaxID=2593676 RepID=UPI000D1ADA1C|nr:MULTISPECIES: hypothetical protein [unclassified Streptomyces]AVV45469.1 hypothetical protein C6376_33045 [Streptomyces sp. P3]MDX5565321.1 hypothetical protein [Streptomyces sp. ID05-04B]
MADSGVPADAELETLRARVAALEAERSRPPAHHRVRSVFAVVLIVLGCVLAPLGLVAAWTSSIVGDTDRYVDTVRPLAADKDVQNAVAGRVTDALMERIDLTALLQDAAPAQRPLLEKALGRLGPSLEDAVRSFVHDKAQAIVASDAFQKIWTDANRRIHSSVEKALTGSGGGAVKIENDTVTLDLAPVVEQVKQRLVDSGMTVAGKIPEIHTDFTLVRSEDIGKVKTYFRVLQLVGFWLPVVAVLLVAAGVLLSTHRRRVLIVAALCFAFATLLLGVALTVFRVVYLDALPAGVSQPAAGSVYDTLVRFLRTSVRSVVALGVVVALAAWLTGPGRHAALARRLWHSGIGAVRTTADHAGMRTGPVGPFVDRYRTWITWILAAGAVLAFLLWPYPTGWVVVGLALALLFALAVVDFLAVPPRRKDLPA